MCMCACVVCVYMCECLVCVCVECVDLRFPQVNPSQLHLLFIYVSVYLCVCVCVCVSCCVDLWFAL